MTSQKKINEIWEKAKEILGENPDVFRKDAYGNKIRKASYGTHGKYGWDKDHKFPKAKGGTDSKKNQQPLHWEENLKKSDKYPYKKK